MPVSAKTRNRYKRLKEAGKKIIVDIWWGPDGEYNWDKYDFPDIAQDPQLRTEFFEKVIDRTIDWYWYEKSVWCAYAGRDRRLGWI